MTDRNPAYLKYYIVTSDPAYFAGAAGMAVGGGGVIVPGQGAIIPRPCIIHGVRPVDNTTSPPIIAKAAHNHRSTATTPANDRSLLLVVFSRVNSTKKLIVRVIVIGNSANKPISRNIVFLLTQYCVLSNESFDVDPIFGV
jgi:hypothetical protein